MKTNNYKKTFTASTLWSLTRKTRTQLVQPILVY